MKSYSLLVAIAFCLVSCQVPMIPDLHYDCYATPSLCDRDSISQFQLIEVVDSQAYLVFDSIININSQSIHHKNGEKTCFHIAEDKINDTLHLSIYAGQYDGFSINEFTSQVSEGAFYYKGYLFVLRKNEEAPTFFRITSNTISVQYYFAQAIIYSCYINQDKYRYPETSHVHSVFSNRKLIRLDCKTNCPPNKWSVNYTD